MNRLLLSLVFVSGISGALAQSRPQQPGAADSSRRAALPNNFPGAAGRAQPKPYKQVITEKAISRRGLFIVHKVDDKYYFEIPDSLLGREILVVSRISKAGADIRAASGYAGDQIGSSVIRFEKGPSNRIFLRKISYRTYSPDSTRSMYNSVNRSNIQAIAAAFNIAAFSENGRGSVIDFTDFISGDSEILYFGSPAAKTSFRLGNLQADRSYIDNVRTFPSNIEITAVKTYALAAAAATGGTGGASAASGSSTVELNTSMVILPKKPMQARFADERIGYFTVGYTDFDLNPQGIKEVRMIKRWRLEPRPEDLAKYKRGELVEPVKPIVYYIDPTTPKKWVPYLIAGVNDWQKAFEKAGFKNAIIGKVAPTAREDSTWSLDDAAHSAIVYKPSETENASGPSISDPRSGEIIESHINWFHNVQKLVHDWYMIQAGAIDPRARKMEFSDELMGDLIRFVSSHEVGHTLGLLHNYGSSSTTPVENLRNKAWVEANGHTASIMDYARFNYVAQPEDNITPKGIYPRIGDYDKWAIEWGYRLTDAKDPASEVPVLNKMAVERLKDRRLFFGTESSPDDPHSQSEDLGDNAMKASEYGIKNLRRIIVGLPEWTRTPNEGYDNLSIMYNALTAQFARYLGHVAKNIGGVYENPKTIEEAGVVYERTPAATQREALAFLDRNLFTTPGWMLDKTILDDTGISGIEKIGRMQETTLNRLLSNSTLSKLIAGEAADGAVAYKITELFSGLQTAIFSEVAANRPIDTYRRNLQKIYIGQLIELVKPPEAPPAAAPAATAARRAATTGPLPSDVLSVVKAELRSIRDLIRTSNNPDTMSKYHLQDLGERIEEALK